MPADVADDARRRYARDVITWLRAPVGSTLSLGTPRESDAREQPTAFAQWLEAWQCWAGPGIVERRASQWRGLGAQELPARLHLAGPTELATLAGMAADWVRLCATDALLSATWPALGETAPALTLLRQVAALSDVEQHHLIALVRWFETHPASGLSPREVPVAGIDSKWIETRTAVIAGLLRAVRPGPHPSDFRTLTGLRGEPTRMRLRVLCPTLRAQIGGLCDIEAPVAELATLPFTPGVVLVVENQATALALRDRPGLVAIFKLGSSVALLGVLPWVRVAPVLYWGDLDTHGMTFLGRARAVLPQVASLLMDETTLLTHQAQWVEEAGQDLSPPHPALTEAEADVLRGLQHGRWGTRIRLEQERLHWPSVCQALDQAMAMLAAPTR